MSRMSTRPHDVVGFGRIFVLFVTLVLLPSMLLSGFGIIAISNEAEAASARRRAAAEEMLDAATTVIVRHLKTVRRTAARLQHAEDGPVPAAVGRAWRVDVEGRRTLLTGSGAAAVPPSPPDPALVAQLVARLPAPAAPRVSAQSALIVLPAPLLTPGAVIQRPGGGWLLVELDVDALATRIAADNTPKMKVRLEDARDRDQRFGVTGLGVSGLDRMASRFWGPPQTVDGEVVVARKLEAPLSTQFLVVRAPPASKVTRIVYIVLLIGFYITLIVGVVLTSRLIWREAKLSRLKTDFVSHVSHELRTPLTSIRMFIETLKLGRAESEEEVQECLELLNQETERLSTMIERVLGYARLQSGRRAFRSADIPVAPIVKDAVAALSAQRLGQAETPIDVDMPADLPRVHADHESIVEAALNLLSNAAKYGDPPIEVRADVQRKRVVLRITDHGPGLSKADQLRIFDRFYRAGNLLSRRTEGAGLGLAITRRIVEAQGGKVWVESAPGHGATFFIALPRAAEV